MATLTNNPGAWVKTPGLDPRDPNAVNFLDIEQLLKLRERVDVAIRKAEQNALFKATAKPGILVRCIRSTHGIAQGRSGILLNAGDLYGDQPVNTVPVQFIGEPSITNIPPSALVIEPQAAVVKVASQGFYGR